MKKSVSLRLPTIALAFLVLGGVVLAGFPGRAHALAPNPPRAIMKQGDRVLQEGRLISYCWIDRCADGVSNYPSAVLVNPGTRLHIRLSENRRPERFSLTSSRSPDGRQRRIETTLSPVRRDGKTVAWNAYFRLERPDSQYYMEAFGVWKNRSGTTRGDAFWQFHAKTRP